MIKRGGEGEYYCRVPFAVGKREVGSLDLLHGLPKLGLPQFCRAIDRKGEAFLLEGKLVEVATTVDLESAAVGRDAAAHEILRLMLNQYAASLAEEVIAKEGALRTLLCLAHEQQAEFSRDINGFTMLTYRLSNDAGQAAQERKCIAERIGLKE